MKANNIYNKMKLDETPTLFLEFHGSKDTVEQQANLASKTFGKKEISVYPN
jgi:hypothetical protein